MGTGSCGTRKTYSLQCGNIIICIVLMEFYRLTAVLNYNVTDDRQKELVNNILLRKFQRLM